MQCFNDSCSICHSDAQAEEVLDPSLKDVPVGIQQKQIIVTCNYKAREYGVKKLGLLTSALEICPNLRVLNGEDITKYRRFSRRICELIRALVNGVASAVEDPNDAATKWPVSVERIGLDEVFLDVTDIIEAHLANRGTSTSPSSPGENHTVWPDGEIVFRLPGTRAGASSEDNPSAVASGKKGQGKSKEPAMTKAIRNKIQSLTQALGGWAAGFSYKADGFDEGTLLVGVNEDDTEIERYAQSNGIFSTANERLRWRNHRSLRQRQIEHLRIATYMARHIRAMLVACTGFTSSAGIASSKLHSKIAAGMKKPNGQTVIVPFSQAAMSLVDKMDVRRLPGVGYRGYISLRDYIRHDDTSNEAFGTWRAAMGNPGPRLDDRPELNEDDMDTDAEGVDSDTATRNNVQRLQKKSDAQSGQAFCQGWGDSDEFMSVQRVREAVPPDGWTKLFGKNGPKLRLLIHGIDDSAVITTGWATQISVEDSFPSCNTLVDARKRIMDLTQSLIERFQEEESIELNGPIRRVAHQLRLTIRRRDTPTPANRAASQNPFTPPATDKKKGTTPIIINGSTYFNNRESQTVPMPAEFHDFNRPADQRATEIVDQTLMPMLRRLLFGTAHLPASAVFPPGLHDAKMVGASPPRFELTLLNVAAVKLKMREASGGGERSIKSFFKPGPKTSDAMSPGIKVTKTEVKEEPLGDVGLLLSAEGDLQDLGIDAATFLELPEDLRIEILQDRWRQAVLPESSESPAPDRQRELAEPQRQTGSSDLLLPTTLPKIEDVADPIAECSQFSARTDFRRTPIPKLDALDDIGSFPEATQTQERPGRGSPVLLPNFSDAGLFKSSSASPSPFSTDEEVVPSSFPLAPAEDTQPFWRRKMVPGREAFPNTASTQKPGTEPSRFPARSANNITPLKNPMKSGQHPTPTDATTPPTITYLDVTEDDIEMDDSPEAPHRDRPSSAVPVTTPASARNPAAAVASPSLVRCSSSSLEQLQAWEGVDPAVFRALPSSIQSEILAHANEEERKRRRLSAPVAGTGDADDGKKSKKRRQSTGRKSLFGDGEVEGGERKKGGKTKGRGSKTEAGEGEGSAKGLAKQKSIMGFLSGKKS
ncbi:hypothetical protein HDU96_002848 [Phlyctochytrium bullatum]|nr:hypothetical protein HDU96_002848 [Phlyctochytrium bullatum]